MVLWADGGKAAEAVVYRVSIAKTGDAALDDTLRAASQLVALRGTPPETLFALVDRARADHDRMETALNSFGYYQPKIAIFVNGHDIDTPASLTAAEGPSKSVPVRIAIDPGPLYHIGSIAFDGSLPQTAQQAVKLKPGAPAIAAEILAGQPDLLSHLREDGYAFATVAPPIAYADDSAHVLEVHFPTQAGRKAKIGSIAFTGLGDLREDFARRVAGLHEGNPYKASTLETARKDLMGLGVFSGVSIHTKESADEDGNAEILIETSARKRHQVSFAADYTTDLGLNISTTWSHRNLLGGAEQLNLSAAGTGLGGNAASGIGYDIAAQFLKPYFLRPDQQWEIKLSAIKQSLKAYDQTAFIYASHITRTLNANWSLSAGLSTTFDSVSQKGDSRYYQLFALPLRARYDRVQTQSAIPDPVGGFRAMLSVTPIVSLGAQNLTFAQIQASGSAYAALSDDANAIIAMRALIGTIQGASSRDLPPDQRFYVGGSGTVRGFRYQSIGPSFSDGDPAGANSVDAVSLEWRQRVWRDWGFALFVDAGQADRASLPFDGTVHVGAGAGLRYYTPIGAVRLDMAVPLTTAPRNDSFQIYISLGQAF